MLYVPSTGLISPIRFHDQLDHTIVGLAGGSVRAAPDVGDAADAEGDGVNDDVAPRQTAASAASSGPRKRRRDGATRISEL